MNQEQRPLYGELVVASSYESQPTIAGEAEVDEETRAMIEEAAYYLAEKRGFAPGHELEDWLKAKLQILKRR
jgi:hypothetical protein